MEGVEGVPFLCREEGGCGAGVCEVGLGRGDARGVGAGGDFGRGDVGEGEVVVWRGFEEGGGELLAYEAGGAGDEDVFGHGGGGGIKVVGSLSGECGEMQRRAIEDWRRSERV